LIDVAIWVGAPPFFESFINAEWPLLFICA
jgi:hypothetical protein